MKNFIVAFVVVCLMASVAFADWGFSVSFGQRKTHYAPQMNTHSRAYHPYAVHGPMIVPQCPTPYTYRPYYYQPFPVYTRPDYGHSYYYHNFPQYNFGHSSMYRSSLLFRFNKSPFGR